MTSRAPSIVRARALFGFVALLVIMWGGVRTATAQSSISPAATYAGSGDIDDMAVWVHPTTPADSLIIGADKSGNKIFVWDISDGALLQSFSSPGFTGNIDVRYNFPIGGAIDIVAFNDRDHTQDNIYIYQINQSTRQLTRIDNQILSATTAYGMCLGVDRTANPATWYVFKTAKDGRIDQIALTPSGSQITGTVVRSFDNGGQTEGCIGDDENGFVYIGEEAGTVWRYDMDPSTGSQRLAINSVNGDLTADIEGQTIYHTFSGVNYLLISSQGASRFDVIQYSGSGPYTYKGGFSIAGVGSTDGIDVSNTNFGGAFSQGVFVVHNGSSTSNVRAIKWADIAAALGLQVDTSWNPRGSVGGDGSVCGNGVLEGNEQCDGSNLGGATCQSRGFSGGTLSCNTNCTFNTNACTTGGGGSAPQITVSKSVSPLSASPGAILAYTLIVQNAAGAGNAQNLVLSDVLPQGVTFVSASHSGTLSGSTVIWPSVTLAAGASLPPRTLTVTVYGGGGGGSPVLTIVAPTPGQTVTSNTVNVTYSQSGNLTEVNHVHLWLDNNAEERDLDNNGSYQFSNVANGSHVLHAYMARADHAQVGARIDVGFTVTVGGGAVCGNGVREGSEQCDGAALGGQTCQSLGYTGGTLSCNTNCTFNINGCTSSGGGGISTDPNLKGAFIGDSGVDSNATAVLQLIKNEGAHFTVHSGDFDYSANPASFESWIDNTLGTNYPYFITPGNHDTSAWGGVTGYQARGKARMQRIGITDPECLNDYGNKSVCKFRGFQMFLSGVGQFGSNSEHEQYLTSKLPGSQHIWKTCSWHEQMAKLTCGGKGDSTGYRVYDICRENGAFIVNGHAHVYCRTRTLVDFANFTVDPAWPQFNVLRIQPKAGSEQGSSFLAESDFVKKRSQARCSTWPKTDPSITDTSGQGCHIWASIYTTTQSSVSGALFITFNVNNDPRKANAYYKNINGQIIDQFTLTRTGQ